MEAGKWDEERMEEKDMKRKSDNPLPEICSEGEG
jgi:hypothetical protein